MSQPKPQKRIAVIGSGLSGLAVAYFLSQTEGIDVTLFERNFGLGMDAGSIQVPGSEKGRMDVPMRALVPTYYAHLASLYDAIQVSYSPRDSSISLAPIPRPPQDPARSLFRTPTAFPTTLAPSDADVEGDRSPGEATFSSSCHQFAGRGWWVPDLPAFSLAMKDPAGYVARLSRTIQVSWDFMRIVKYAADCLGRGDIHQARNEKGPFARMTLRSWKNNTSEGKSYSEPFWETFIPIWSVMCTCTLQEMYEFPAFLIFEYVAFCLPNGKLSHVTSGVKEVCEKLSAPIQKVLSNTTVVGIARHSSAHNFIVTTVPTSSSKDAASTPTVHDAFDNVIFATQANQASNILKATLTPSSSENVYSSFVSKVCAVLDKWQYAKSLVVCHTDTGLLPRFRSEWRSLNFGVSAPPSPGSVDDTEGALEIGDGYDVYRTAQCTHIQVGAQNGQAPLLQTTNPVQLIDRKKVVSAMWFERALVTVDSPGAIKELRGLQGGGGGVYFVGSYCGEGIPLLEGCVTTALEVGKLIAGDKLFTPAGMLEEAERRIKSVTEKSGKDFAWWNYLLFISILAMAMAIFII